MTCLFTISEGDCADDNPAIKPRAIEVYDGVDNLESGWQNTIISQNLLGPGWQNWLTQQNVFGYQYQYQKKYYECVPIVGYNRVV